MGLGLIIIAGAELLTANSCYLSAAVFEVSCSYAYDLLKPGPPSPPFELQQSRDLNDAKFQKRNAAVLCRARPNPSTWSTICSFASAATWLDP